MIHRAFCGCSLAARGSIQAADRAGDTPAASASK